MALRLMVVPDKYDSMVFRFLNRPGPSALFFMGFFARALLRIIAVGERVSS